MTIYVNKKNKKFLKVVDDPEAAQDYLDDLKQDNFRFFIALYAAMSAASLYDLVTN